jgi:ribosomal protein S18 acetylase RimI-like enzyme
MYIRLATLDDIEPICKLYNEFFAYNADLQPAYYKAEKESGEYPRGTITGEKSDIFLAIEKDTVVGLVHIREAQTPPYNAFVPHNYAEIVDFITTEKYRKKGIGAKLMDAAKQWAKMRNLDYIELFVLSNAKDGFHFYERKDFVVTSHTMRCPL